MVPNKKFYLSDCFNCSIEEDKLAANPITKIPKATLPFFLSLPYEALRFVSR